MSYEFEIIVRHSMVSLPVGSSGIQLQNITVMIASSPTDANLPQGAFHFSEGSTACIFLNEIFNSLKKYHSA